MVVKVNLKRSLANWNGALMFYTCLPIPSYWPLAFDTIARWVPWVGGIIGSLLVLIDLILMQLNTPRMVSSALIVAVWIVLTGGLHLDGVMDSADGLAVPDKTRRLAVMADSRMGAFGGMAAVILLLLKVIALSSMRVFSYAELCFALIAVCVWGRWAQQWAIARYPYLKKEGKGAFHKAALPSVQYTLPSLVIIGLLSIALVWLNVISTSIALRTTLGGLAVAMLTNAYFVHHFGGHTGDTYGAVVEWSEALLLCLLTMGG